MFLPASFSPEVSGSPLLSIQKSSEMRRELLLRAIVRDRRTEILAKRVLNYRVYKNHQEMIDFQNTRSKGVILGFRGAGKSIICDTCKCVQELVCDPVNTRILLVSKTLTQAQSNLKPIKHHIENNLEFRWLFGELKSDSKWDLGAIDLAPKSMMHKEHSVLCAGIDTSFVGGHFTHIVCDDLVDKRNSATMAQREKLRQWFYEVLEPCLEIGGQMWLIGSRYHYDDLYGKLLKGEFKNHLLVVPGLDEKGESTCPELYPTEYFIAKKAKAGTIIFNAQIQNDTDPMRGKVFKEEWMGPNWEVDSLPSELMVWQGVDLASSQGQRATKFSSVVVGVKDRNIFILGAEVGQHTFLEQMKRLADTYRKFSPIRMGVEANAYQLVVHQFFSEQIEYKDIRSIPVYSESDKWSKAWKLSAYFEGGRVYWVKGMRKYQDMLINLEEFDFMDALYIAVQMGLELRWRKKNRTAEPGLI